MCVLVIIHSRCIMNYNYSGLSMAPISNYRILTVPMGFAIYLKVPLTVCTTRRGHALLCYEAVRDSKLTDVLLAFLAIPVSVFQNKLYTLLNHCLLFLYTCTYRSLSA